MAEEKIKTTKKKSKTDTTSEMAISISKNAVDKKIVAKEKRKQAKVTADVYSVEGKVIDKVVLPEKIFGAKVNNQLIAQAVRVYLANQRQGTAATKSRGEVTGSTRKIYRQKGTGRARHGGIRAPIFVHGGIAHGPKPQDHSLKMPLKMKRAALFAALTAKLQDGAITVVDGVTKLEPKTKAMYAMLKRLGLIDKKINILVVLPHDNAEMYRAMRNIACVAITASNRLNTYDVLNNTKLLLLKEAVSVITETFTKEKHA